MDSLIWLVAGTLLGIGIPAAILLSRRGRASVEGDESPTDVVPMLRPVSGSVATTKPASREPAKRPASFHGITVHCGPHTCTAIRAIQTTRFLSKDAPRLPLPDCDEPRCQCRYDHHQDRRAGDERRDVFATWGGFGPNALRANERKKKRRSVDKKDGAGRR